jgi:quercetin dioxygenase-like cupin family protein
MSEHASRPSVTSIVRRNLLSASIAGGRHVSRVEVKQIDFQPGQETGLHLHPIPVVGYIAKGTIRFQLEGGPMLTLPAGSAFFEPANVRVLLPAGQGGRAADRNARRRMSGIRHAVCGCLGPGWRPFVCGSSTAWRSWTTNSAASIDQGAISSASDFSRGRG